MNCNKVDSSLFIDEKYGLIKNIYSFPTYYGLPKVYVKMAFGGNYSTAGFNASGAGITPENAENSAVGEYIERYSCLHPNNLEVIKEGIKKIDPSYLNSEASNNYDDYKWKECLDCVNNKIVALPVDAIYLTYRSNKTNRWITTATGAACGENQYQCMWKGISEVLERDAFQYIWRRQLPCKRISIEANTILKKYFDNYIKCSNIKFRLYKMELDWNVPAVFGVAEFQNGGCVVAACVRHTWIEACKKTLLELTQSIIGYAAVVFNKERIRIDNFDNINDYQDHSILYFNDNMCKHLYFLDKENKEFNINEEVMEKDDKEIYEQLLNEMKKIKKDVYYVDVTSKELKRTNWLVGKTIIPNMLDIEPNFIKVLKHKRLEEIDDNLISRGIRIKEELKNNQPIVPHPFP